MPRTSVLGKGGCACLYGRGGRSTNHRSMPVWDENVLEQHVTTMRSEEKRVKPGNKVSESPSVRTSLLLVRDVALGVFLYDVFLRLEGEL